MGELYSIQGKGKKEVCPFRHSFGIVIGSDLSIIGRHCDPALRIGPRTHG